MKRISKCQLWRLLKGYWASSNLILGKPARPDLGERWPSRLVATAAEDRLNIKASHTRRLLAECSRRLPWRDARDNCPGLVSISQLHNFIIFYVAAFFALAGGLPPNRPEPPVHRKRYSRTNHAGHNKKHQAKSEYRIGKVQRTNCGTHPNKQGPCGQADAPDVQLEAPLGEVAGGLWAGQHRGETQITSSQYYISAGAICNGTVAPRGDLSGCVRPLE